MNEATESEWAIKSDCEHCAHKHLTAAYALLTSNASPDNAVASVTSVLMARAMITTAESFNGYKGNIDLAKGCLAAAEALTRNEEKAWFYRDVRLHLDELGNREATLGAFNNEPDIAAHAFAHLAEAHRELPSIALPRLQLDRGPEGELRLRLPFACEDFLKLLVKEIFDVAELYELHNKETPLS